MRYFFILVSVIVCGCARTQEAGRLFILGDTTIELKVYRSEKPGPLYYNMHDDENTSLEAAKKVMEENGGVLYELAHSGNRNIEFLVDSTRYEIDPNRIYTEAGVWRELRRVALRDSLLTVMAIRVQDSLGLVQIRDSLFQAGDSILYGELFEMLKTNPVVVEGGRLSIRLPLPPLQFNARDTLVFAMVRSFAQELLSVMKIDSQDLVIALHNNTNNGYSLDSYLTENIYEEEAIATYRGLHPDADDFYFVTERWIYEALQPNYYHIILQDNHNMTDDGSLSVYCGQRGIHYVNVEAQHKHEKEQKEMLEILLERLVK